MPHARRDAVLPRAREHGDRGQRRRRRARAARDRREPRRGRGRPACSSARSPGPRTRWASPSSSSPTTRTSTCTGPRRSRSSRAPGATSAMAASGWRTRRASPSGCCGTTPAGRPSASTPPCRAERPTQVNLSEPLRVVIFYDTVHVNSEGIVHFVGDIYGHDRALDQALARGYPYPSEGRASAARGLGRLPFAGRHQAGLDEVAVHAGDEGDADAPWGRPPRTRRGWCRRRSPPRPSAATILRTRSQRSGWPWGSSASCATLAAVNSMAEAFGQAATQAPQPMQAAASMAWSAFSLRHRDRVAVRRAAGGDRDEAARRDDAVEGARGPPSGP